MCVAGGGHDACEVDPRISSKTHVFTAHRMDGKQALCKQTHHSIMSTAHAGLKVMTLSPACGVLYMVWCCWMPSACVMYTIEPSKLSSSMHNTFSTAAHLARGNQSGLRLMLLAHLSWLRCWLTNAMQVSFALQVNFPRQQGAAHKSTSSPCPPGQQVTDHQPAQHIFCGLQAGTAACPHGSARFVFAKHKWLCCRLRRHVVPTPAALLARWICRLIRVLWTQSR